MKKVIILFVAFFYLITASGMNVSLHYCGGKLKNISFLKTTDNPCCCNKTKKNTCCKKKVCCKKKSIVVVKVKDNHSRTSDLTGSNVKWFKIFSVSLVQATVNFSNNYYSEIIPDYNAPPDLYHTPIYLQHRVLII